MIVFSRIFRRIRPRLSVLVRLSAMMAFGACGGCVELGIIPPPDNGGSIPDGNGGGNGASETLPRVRLTASNTTPQVNEELVLRCELANEVEGGVRFEFETGSAVGTRFVVDQASGIARVIIQETDIGVTFSVACAGVNEFGAGPLSNSLVIVPSATLPPP